MIPSNLLQSDAFTGRGLMFYSCLWWINFRGRVSVSSCGFVNTYCPPPKDGGGEKLVVGGYFVVLNDTVVAQPGQAREGSGQLGLFRNGNVQARFSCYVHTLLYHTIRPVTRDQKFKII